MGRAQRPRPGYHPRGGDAWHPEPGRQYATAPGWGATEAELPEVRNRTHDILIKLMGAQRRGGVRWLTYDGLQAIAVCADNIAQEQRGSHPADHGDGLTAYRDIGALLQAHGGFLVIALAEGDPGVPA